MCKDVCLCHLVKRAIDWFEKNEYDSASWRLGRLAVEGLLGSNLGLTSRILCDTINSIRSNLRCTNNLFISTINASNITREHAILLFLISWNPQRFTCDSNNSNVIVDSGRGYKYNIANNKVIEAWGKAIKIILYLKKRNSNNPSNNLFYKVAYEIVFKILKKFFTKIFKKLFT